MSETDMGARVAVNETEIKILRKEMEQMRVDNRNDHLLIEKKIDALTKQVTQLVERNDVEREKDKAVLSVRMWLIGIVMGIITFIITWVTHK